MIAYFDYTDCKGPCDMNSDTVSLKVLLQACITLQWVLEAHSIALQQWIMGNISL